MRCAFLFVQEESDALDRLISPWTLRFTDDEVETRFLDAYVSKSNGMQMNVELLSTVLEHVMIAHTFCPSV